MWAFPPCLPDKIKPGFLSRLVSPAEIFICPFPGSFHRTIFKAPCPNLSSENFPPDFGGMGSFLWQKFVPGISRAEIYATGNFYGKDISSPEYFWERNFSSREVLFPRIVQGSASGRLNTGHRWVLEPGGVALRDAGTPCRNFLMREIFNCSNFQLLLEEHGQGEFFGKKLIFQMKKDPPDFSDRSLVHRLYANLVCQKLDNRVW